MVEKITISPSEVRGYGDIVSPKTTEDFTNYMSGLTESDGVYTLVYDETGTYLNLSASPTTVSYGGSSVVFTAVLTQTGEPVEGETVSFYEGETLLGTDTTDSNGEATLTKSDFSIGSHSVKAVYDEVESNAVSVTVTKVAVTVSLSADSSSITYGSNVVLSGVLSLGSGVTVTIYDGTTSLGTVTTGTGGAFSKTVTTPSVGSHSFKVEYAGDTTHDSATASTSVTVNKIASTISLSASSSQITVGDSVILSGTVSVGSGANIKIYNGSSLIDTVTSGSAGAFLKSVSGLSVGQYTFKAVFDGDETHSGVTSSNVTVSVVDTPTPVPASIDLTGTKSILSYADSESSVLTATVLDSSDNPVEGVDVNLYNGSTLWDTLTTDSSGECSKTYSSAGSGDITFTAEVDGTLLTKTYDVEDCINYDSMTSNSGKWTIPSACSTAYDSNGAKFGTATSYSQVKLTEKLTSPCNVEFTLVDYNSDWNDSVAVIVIQYTNGETAPNQYILAGGYKTNSYFDAFGTRITHSLIKGAKYRIEYDNTMKIYENNTLLASTSNTVGLPTRLEFHVGSGGNRWVKVKDVKVKPL